jgi:hypothetical protein
VDAGLNDEDTSPIERAYSAQDFTKVIGWFRNAYPMFCANICRQATAIPMGTNIAQNLTQLHLRHYEVSFMIRRLPKFRSMPEDMKVIF